MAGNIDELNDSLKISYGKDSVVGGMMKSMAPGGGGRFAALGKKGLSAPLRAWTGRKRYGAGKFQSMAAKGRSRAATASDQAEALRGK